MKKNYIINIMISFLTLLFLIQIYIALSSQMKTIGLPTSSSAKNIVILYYQKEHNISLDYSNINVSLSADKKSWDVYINYENSDINGDSFKLKLSNGKIVRGGQYD